MEKIRRKAYTFEFKQEADGQYWNPTAEACKVAGRFPEIASLFERRVPQSLLPSGDTLQPRPLASLRTVEEKFLNGGA
jgi:transposase-like protein